MCVRETLVAVTNIFQRVSGLVLSYLTVLAEDCKPGGVSVPHSHLGAQAGSSSAVFKIPFLIPLQSFPFPPGSKGP